MNPKFCAHSLRHVTLCSRVRGECKCGLQRHPEAIAASVTRAQPTPPPAYKECVRCKRPWPNTFEHFTKKLSGSRTTFATSGVCKLCKSAALKEGHAERWRRQ